MFRSVQFRASRALLRRKWKTEPCTLLVPLLVTRVTWLPMFKPYSALKEFVTTRYSRMPSTPSEFSLELEAPVLCKSFMMVPSMVKRLERVGAPLLLNWMPFRVPAVLAARFSDTPGCASVRSL